MKVSFGSWAFSFGPYASHPIPFPQVVEGLARAGYDGIELCGFPPYITLENYAAAAKRRELKQMLEAAGLGISGYAPDFSLVNPLVPENRQKYLDLFRRCLELCADIQSPLMRLDTGGAPGSIGETEYAAAKSRLGALWREAAEEAAQAGVRLVWEFEPGFAFNKPSEIVALHDAVGHANFQILFDTSHAYLCTVVGARQHGEPETVPGGVVEWLERLKGRIGHVHLVDTDGTLYGEETSRHCPLGQGVIDWEKLGPKLRALADIAWWCVDLSFWPEIWPLLKPSLEFARRLLSADARSIAETRAPGL